MRSEESLASCPPNLYIFMLCRYRHTDRIDTIMTRSTPVFFISDAHLGAPRLQDDRQREKQLIAFLEYAAAEGGEIYIVGDLFEFWFEYRQVIPKHNFPILVALYRIASSGVTIRYLPGNHDLWIGDFLRDEIGLHVLPRATEVRQGAFNIFVTHGDGMAKRDYGYRALRRILTHRLNIALYRWLHPDIGIPFAKRMSQVSREKGQNKNPFDADYREFALSKFAEGYNGVIMGHTHFPLHEIYDDRHYINLGDWIRHFSYAELRNDGPVLRQWPSKTVLIEPETKNWTPDALSLPIK